MYARRIRISLWVAVLEGVIAALSSQSTRYLIFAVAIVILALYIFAGRKAQSDTWRQLSWIGAASQSLVVLVTLLAQFIFHILAFVLAAVFAAVALFFLFTDRG